MTLTKGRSMMAADDTRRSVQRAARHMESMASGEGVARGPLLDLEVEGGVNAPFVD